MAFTDFPNGLKNANDYLSANRQVRAELTGSVADISRLVVSAEIDYNLKEIICSLLAGRGLKLPNIQICISLNLKELLGIAGLQQRLYDALNKLDQALDSFLDHLNIDAVLGRLNGVIAEATNIASMINFCSAPLDPIAIPNVLENAMGSLLGAGKELIDKIGCLVPDQIQGCLTPGGFNCAAFESGCGILGNLCDNIGDVTAGSLSDAFLDSIDRDVNTLTAEINALIDKENNISGSYDLGGSDFDGAPPPINPDIGVLHNPTNIQQCTNIAYQLKGAFDQLGSYQVIKSNGDICNNIFETFVDPSLLAILRRTTEPVPRVSEQVPIYNYCGEIVGFQEVVDQTDAQESTGSEPVAYNEPGYLAGGRVTDPSAIDDEDTAEGTVINNITNVTNVSGDTQFSSTATTVNATPLEILFEGVRQTPESGNTWFFEITAVGKKTNTTREYGAFRLTGIVDNAAGVVTIGGAGPTKETYENTAGAAAWDLTAAVTGSQFRVFVTGAAGHDITWNIKFKYQEV